MLAGMIIPGLILTIQGKDSSTARGGG
jgi:hypothetical protein